MTFKYVELFAGIGGFRQAFDRLGGQCVFASEIDKFATNSYRALYNGAPELHGDVTKIDASSVPDHDLLVGGFPCQAFSVAGQRRGFEDSRGTLFFEAARIAKEKQPKMLLLENVKGLVGHDKGRTLEVMIGTLAEIGYTVDFNVLNSKYFGVPQNRERIFIVGVRDDLVALEPWVIEGTNVVAKGKRRIQHMDGVKTFNFDWPTQSDVTTRLRDILETDVDEKYYLSEDKTAKLVAQLEATTGETITEDSDNQIIQQAESGVRLREESGTLRTCLNHQHVVESGIDRCDSALKQYEKFYETNGYIPEFFNPYNCAELEDTAPTLTAQCTRINASSTVLKLEKPSDEPQMLGHIDLKGHDAIKRVYSAEGVSPTLTTMGGGHREPKIAEEQEYSWEDEFRVRREDKTTTAEQFTVGSDGRRCYRIRKLTPLECWRLQGFPDSAHDTVKAAGISDSQRYKQAGNAVTVTVILAIGRQLLRYIDEREAVT